VLAGLVLDTGAIQRVLRRELMRESAMYQEIWQEGQVDSILKQLTKRFGALSPPLQSQIQGLLLAQLEKLGESLLDFQTLADLTNWLQKV
jgi:predicted transposase YdaD